MKITFPLSALKAAAICAAKKDARYYMNGVHVHFDVKTMYAQVSGTDGHVLMTGRVPFTFEDDAQTASWSMIIPLAAIPKKGTTATLESLPDGRYMLNDIVFAPIDGRFPDVGRVIPSAADFASTPAEIGTYDPNLILRAHDALHTFYGTTKGTFYLHQRGPRESAVMAGHDSAACAIVMPMRVTDSGDVPVYQFNRDSLAPA